jgi:hypothetical protein
LAATRRSSQPAKKAEPAKEYLHVVMAMHPLHQKPVPVATYEDEEAAWKAAAAGNADPKTAMMGYHVKKIAKGS